MKLCPYCGARYTDDVERCAIDNAILPSVPEPGVPPVLSSVTESPGMVAPVGNEAFWNDRRLLMLELLMVCLVIFGSAIVSSSYHFLYGYDTATTGEASGSAIYTWLYRLERELSALGLVWFVLLRRGKTFKDIGLVWRWIDLGWALVLIIAGHVSFRLIYSGIYWTGLTATSQAEASRHVAAILFGGGVSGFTLLFQLVNPFFEELIVRAYLMTGVKYLTGSAAAAVIISTVLQTSYHFYQGAPAAISHGGTFLLFSLFYARTGRIMPIILAHMYFDVNGTIWYLTH